jgi:hypothetical protein
MQKIGKFGHAAKVIALCLPPVIMALTGLAMSRKKGGNVVAGKTSPGVGSKRAQRDVGRIAQVRRGR